MKKIAWFLTFAMVIVLSPVWAIDAPLDEGLAKIADHNSYTVKTPGMLLYGLYELGESPLEILHQPYELMVGQKDWAFGLPRGINKGTNNFLEGATRGVFDIFRSFIPGMGRYEPQDNQVRTLPVLGA